MPGKILTALTKMEAESRWSDGRLQEALDIYTTLRTSSVNMTVNTKAAIDIRITTLQKELAELNPEENRDIVKTIQNPLPCDESILVLLKKANFFYRKGRYVETLDNIRLLLRLNSSVEFCVTTVAICITRLYTVEEVSVAVDLFLTESFQNAYKAAVFKMMLADKMAQKGFEHYAEKLYQHKDRFTPPR